MLGFEPRSRQHDTSVCSPLHHTGKNSCCHTPETVPSLCSLVTEEVATYILQPVDWFAHFCVGTAATPREVSNSMAGLVVTFI